MYYYREGYIKDIKMILRVKRDDFKKYSIVLSVFLGLIALIFLTPLGSVLATTSSTFTVSLAIGNQLLNITVIEQNSNITPIDGTTARLIITFDVEDANGVADINISSGLVTINQSGTVRNSVPGNCTQISSSGNTATINCSVLVYYFDLNGYWDLSINISDNFGVNASNTSNIYNVTIGTLSAMTLTPASLSFGTALSQGQKDINATDDPLQVNNTGNQAFNTVQVTGVNLAGTTTPSQLIPASNFTVNVTNTVGTGTYLINGTLVTIIDASVAVGNNTFDELFFFLDEINSSISAQTYDSTLHGSWNVTVS